MTKSNLIRLLAAGIMILLIPGCGQVNAPADSPEIPAGNVSFQEYSKNGISTSVPVPENWYIADGFERQGTLTVKLSNNKSDDTFIIFVVTPTEMNTAALVQTGEKLLSGSLYQPGTISKLSQKIGSRNVQVLTADAGQNQVVARTAAFSERGKSYFLTLITREPNFEESVHTLELMLGRIK
jgi:hypothetical protein